MPDKEVIHQGMRKKRWIGGWCFLLLAAGCAGPKPVVTTILQGHTQGGSYRVVVKSDRDRSDLQEPVDSLLGVIERSMSLYDPRSLICRLNRNETDSLDLFITRCIETAAEISRESDGYYDITVKPLVEAWGFLDKNTSAKSPNIDSLLQYVGYEKIAIRDGRLAKSSPGVQIDLNSIAQGATADEVGRFLEEKGIGEYLIEVGGGEIFCRGTNPNGTPWRVGIDKPAEGNFTPGANLQMRLHISDQGLATSGNYRKFKLLDDGRKVVHTLNPKTGYSVESNLLSATVLAESAALADAYGTLLMVLGLERSIDFLATKPGLLACLIHLDETGKYQTWISPRLERKIIQ